MRGAERLSDAHLVTAVYITHGVLDALVTLQAFVSSESTEMESNPVVRRLLWQALSGDVILRLPGETCYNYTTLWCGVAPAALVMLLVPAVACGMLWLIRDLVPAWRIWTGALAAFGLLIVVNNLLAF